MQQDQTPRYELKMVFELLPGYELNNAVSILRSLKSKKERLQLAKKIKDSWNILPEESLDVNTYTKNILSAKDLAYIDNCIQYSGILPPKEEKKKEKKETTQEEKVYVSCFIKEGILYEQCYNHKTNQSYFINSNKETAYSFQHNDKEYVPVQGEELEKKAVLLPERPEDYGTDEELDREIKNFIHKWLDIPDDVLQFAIWNIKRSWVYERFHTLNYLRALGDTGQGKSRFLDTLGHIHYKPIITSGASTAAPIFRAIDKWRGTMIFDECDLKASEETADIIKVINQGYERGKFVMRCDQNDASKIMYFDPFCPKIIATRKPFEDKAVESRCITQVMTGTKRKDIKFSLNDDFFNDTQTLRNKLLQWRFNNFFIINPGDNFNIEFQDFEPRVQQIVTSYVALFGRNPDEMKRFKTFIKNYQEELIDERQNSWEGQIVLGIHGLISKGVENICSQDIIEEAVITNNKGQLLKPRALSNVLKELGFGKSVLQRTGGVVKRCIPLSQVHLDELFKRYGCNTVTLVTPVWGSMENHVLSNISSSEAGSPHNNVTTLPSLHCEEITEKEWLQGIFSDEEIVTYVKQNDKGNGVWDEVITKSLDISNERLTNLLEKGLLFLLKPGRYKAL